MAFQHHGHGRPQVIQGNFQGRQPAFTAQARPAFPQAAQRQRAPHVQAALQRHAPKHYTAQRHVGPQPQAAQPSRIGNAFRVPPTVNLSNPGQGRPLPEAVRRKMESVFNTDFSDVRVHVGAQAQSIGAVAFTMGSQIHFATGQYNPDTSHGQRLLGHELMHVMQQRSGRMRNPFGGGVAVVQDPGMEAEAERMGIQAAAYRVPMQAKPVAQQQPAHVPGGRPQAPHVQAAVAQTKTAKAKTAQLHDQARPLAIGGPPEMIQGTFSGGFEQAVQLRKPKAVKKAMTSTTLTQTENTKLREVAKTFVGSMSALQIAAFQALGTPALRRNWLVGPTVPFRVGDVVEEVGQVRLGQHATKTYGRGAKQITSVTLRFRDTTGAAVLGPLGELDALVLDSRGRVKEIVSAKLNPGQVHQAQDRALLSHFYNVVPKRPLNQSVKAYHNEIKDEFPHVWKSHLANNNVDGFRVQYDEDSAGKDVPLEDFLRAHPLAAGTVAGTPVRGLTPTPDTSGQVSAAEERGDIRLGLNRDDLLDALGAEMLKEMG